MGRRPSSLDFIGLPGNSDMLYLESQCLENSKECIYLNFVEHLNISSTDCTDKTDVIVISKELNQVG